MQRVVGAKGIRRGTVKMMRDSMRKRMKRSNEGRKNISEKENVQEGQLVSRQQQKTKDRSMNEKSWDRGSG